jgi:hypothetical protein
MTQALKKAQARTSALPTPQGLEGTDSTGHPWLPSPIPDNPLVAGVATVGAACGDTTDQVGSDWWYCPETGTIQAGGLYKGNE